MSTTPEQRTIAAGGNPLWEHTVTHPTHGELTFRARLPLAKDSLRHSIAVDNELAGLAGEPSNQTMIIAGALAGMAQDPGKPAGKGLLIDLPAVDETVEYDEDSGRESTRRVFYDAQSEPDPTFLGAVWLEFSAWRAKQLSDATVRAVGESSPAEEPSTPSAGSSTP